MPRWTDIEKFSWAPRICAVMMFVAIINLTAFAVSAQLSRAKLSRTARAQRKRKKRINVLRQRVRRSPASS